MFLSARWGIQLHFDTVGDFGHWSAVFRLAKGISNIRMKKKCHILIIMQSKHTMRPIFFAEHRKPWTAMMPTLSSLHGCTEVCYNDNLRCHYWRLRYNQDNCLFPMKKAILGLFSCGLILSKHKLHQIPKRKSFSFRLAVVFTQFIEARC